jgi:transcriptional regulator with XRE-family HTH domain
MAQDITKLVQANLMALAKAQSISQPTLAKRAKLSHKTVNNLFNAAERGFSPTLDTLMAVASGLQVSVADLFAGAVRPPVIDSIGDPKSIARQFARLSEDFLLSSETGEGQFLS